MSAISPDQHLEELPVLSTIGASTIVYAVSDPGNESYQLAVSTLFTSPQFSGNPTAPTQPGTDSSNRLATTQFVQSKIAGLNTSLASKQPIDNTLTALASLTITPNTLIYGTGTDAFALANLTPFARTLLDDPDAATARATLGVSVGSGGGGTPGGASGQVQWNNAGVFAGFGSWDGVSILTVTGSIHATSFAGDGSALTGVVLVSGSYANPSWITSLAGSKITGNITGNAASITGSIAGSQVTGLNAALASTQPLDGTLTALSALTITPNTLIYGTGADAFALSTLTPFMRTLLDDVDQVTAQNTLGVTGGGGGGGVTFYPDRASLQAAIDAAGVSGGLITILNTVPLDGPLLIRGTGVVLDGQGIGKLTYLHPYHGSLLILGPANAGPLSNSHYVPSVLTGGAAAGRFGLAMLGTHTLVISNGCFSYGCTSGSQPLYFQDDFITLETCLVFPVILSNIGLMGFHDGTNSDPFAVWLPDSSSIAISFTTSDGVQHTQQGSINLSAPKNDFCWQRNSLTGDSVGFLNGSRIFRATVAPGLRLRKPIGFTPFMIGATNSAAPLPDPPPANFQCHGLGLSGGPIGRYDPNNVTQTLLATGHPPSDYERYFNRTNPGDAQVIGYLPLQGPGVVDCIEPVNAGPGAEAAFWLDSTRSAPTGQAYNTVIQGLKFVGATQASLLIGSTLTVRIEECVFTQSLGSIQSLPVSGSTNYVVSIINCIMDGSDAAISLVGFIYNTLNLELHSVGRFGVRENTCTSTHAGKAIVLTPSGTTCEFMFDIYGGTCDINLATDEENGWAGAIAYIRYTQGMFPGRLAVHGLDTSIWSVPGIMLRGSNASFPPVEIDVRGITTAFGDQQSNTLVSITGPDVWYGRIMGVGLHTTNVSYAVGPGTANTVGAAAHLEIRNRESAFLKGPPQTVAGSRATDAWCESVGTALENLGVVIDDSRSGYANRAELQAALDVAAVSGGLVTFHNEVPLDGPLIIHGARVILDGQGAGSLRNMAESSYYGSLLLVSEPLAPNLASGNHYPVSVLDPVSTAGVAPIFGLATRGTTSLIITSDGMALGCTGAGVPLYYQDNCITIETCVAFPTTCPTSLSFMGNSNFGIRFYPDGSTLNFLFFTSDGVIQQLSGPVDQTASKIDICFQRNSPTGRTILFINGTRVATAIIAPGLRFQQQNGLSALGIGCDGGQAPGNGQTVIDIICYGLKVSGGDVVHYDETLTTQTQIRTGLPPADRDRYFYPFPGDPPIIGYLPMNGSAVVPGTINVRASGGDTVAFWCEANRPQPTANNNIIRGINFKAGAQACIFTAEQLMTTFENIDVHYPLNSFATLQSSAGFKYIVKFYNCFLTGSDASIVAQNTEIETYSITLYGTGRDGIRESGCDTHHYGFIFCALPFSGHIIDIQGGSHTSHGISMDDENGGQGDAYIRIVQGIQGQYIEIMGFATSVGSKPYFKLVGHNSTAGFVELFVKGLYAFGGQQDPRLMEVIGADCWHGEIDATGIGGLGITGIKPHLLNIKAFDTAFLTAKPQRIVGLQGSDIWNQSVSDALSILGLVIDDSYNSDSYFPPSGVLVDDRFRHDATTYGGVGSTTGIPTTPDVGAVNGWIDVGGNFGYINGINQVALHGGIVYSTSVMVRPTSEGCINGRVRALVYVPVASQAAFCAVLRFNGYTNDYYVANFSSVSYPYMQCFYYLNNVLTTVVVSSTSVTLVDGHWYSFEAEVNGDTITMSVFDFGTTSPVARAPWPTSGTLIATGTGTDSSNPGSSTSQYGFATGVYNTMIVVGRVEITDLDI